MWTMKYILTLLQLCLIAQHDGFPTMSSGKTEGGSAPQAMTSCKCENDESYSTACYKPSREWSKLYTAGSTMPLKGCDEECVSHGTAEMVISYKAKTILGKNCYMECPCRCLSFCEESSFFSKSITCPHTTSEGLYCITSNEETTETAVTRTISAEMSPIKHTDGSMQSAWHTSTETNSFSNDDEENDRSLSTSSPSSFLTNPVPFSSLRAFSSALTSPVLSSTQRSSTPTSTVIPSTLRTEPVYSSKILSTPTSSVPATSYANDMELLHSTATRQTMITTNFVEGNAETTHLDDTPLTTGSSSSTSYLGHTDEFASDSEETQSSAFSPSVSQESTTTTYVADEESDSTLSEAHSSVVSWTSKDVVRTPSSHASQATSIPLKGSEAVRTTSPHPKAVTDEAMDVSPLTFEKEMGKVSSSTFGEEYLRTATSSDEPSSTKVQAMEPTTPTTTTAASKVEVSSLDSTTRASSEPSASSTIVSSQGHSSDVDLEHRTQTTNSQYSTSKEATTEKLLAEFFYTSKVQTSTAPKTVSTDAKIFGSEESSTSSFLTNSDGENEQKSKTATSATAARSSDSPRRLSTGSFRFTTHGHYHHSSTISDTWSFPKTTESSSTDAGRGDATSASTKRLPVTDALLKQQEVSSAVQTDSTADTTDDAQRTQTTDDTSNQTDSVTGSSPNCSLPCPPEYVEGASYCYRFAHKSVHTYRAAVKYCSLEKNSYLASLIDIRKDELIPILRNASDENATLAELLFINEQKSKFFTVTKTARIVSLTRSSGTLLRIVRTVGIDEYLANSTGICKIPKHCRDFECNLGDIAFYGVSKELQLPENRTMSPGETAKIFCKNGKAVDVVCEESGSFDPHPSMIPCYDDDVERDTVWNPRVRKSCAECHRLGTKRCVRVQGGVQCQCHEGWSKFTCWESPDMCKLTQLKCLHGSCKSEVDRAYCKCDYGFAGAYCTVNKTTITMYSDTENSIVSSQTGSALALVLTKTVLLLTYVLLKAENTLRRNTDPQMFYQRVRSYILITAGMLVLLYRHPGILVITKRMCRVIFFGITSLLLAAVGTFALEARNACETVKLQHLNTWRDEPQYSSRTVSLGALLAKTNSLGKQLLTVFVFSTGAVIAIFAAKYEQVSSEWSCLGLFEKETINLWFPLVLLHHIAALAATAYSYEGLTVVRHIPQLREQLDEYLKTVPDFVKNDIEKSCRNLIFSMIGPWLLTGCWLSLAVSNDWVTSPVLNMLTLSSALLYCAFDLLQFAVTTPLVYSKLVCLAIRWLPASLAPKQDPVTMMQRSEVVKRFQLRRSARRSRRGRLSNPAHEGYVPRVVRSEMKKRWSRGYRRLREIHDRKTKASVIHMIHRNDVVRLLLDEKNKEKRKTIRKLFLRWSAVTYRDDPKPDVVLRRRTMFDILMDELEEIRRNLRLLNQPTHREVYNNDEEDTETKTEISIEKCIITTIDSYGNTQQQVVLKTPIHMIDSEDIPSTSSGRGAYDRMERGEPSNEDEDDILSEETLEWLEMASETTFDMAAQNQDYMDQLKALRSW